MDYSLERLKSLNKTRLPPPTYTVPDKKCKKIAPCEDRTHDLRIPQIYETCALPTELTERLVIV